MSTAMIRTTEAGRPADPAALAEAVAAAERPAGAADPTR
jgi:hypothetical protein